MSAQYIVQVPFGGMATVEVVASSRKEAIQFAIDMVGQMDWVQLGEVREEWSVCKDLSYTGGEAEVVLWKSGLVV